MMITPMIFSSCGFVHDEKITGPYRLIAVDVDQQMSVCYDLGNGSAIGRIGETVFAYGYNDRYIVAKQHPNNNNNITNYFYLDMTKDEKYAEPSESVVGPLSESQFLEATHNLNLPAFSRTLNHLK